jgi:D-3-phosphoglycerate dehydrogenase
MKILISDAFDPSLPGKLSKYGQVTDDKTQLSTADIVLVRSKTKCTKEYIDSAPNLKMIIRGGVGLDNIDKEHAKSKSIIVKNTAEASAIAVAELAFALMLSLPNRIVKADTSMKAGQWLKKELERTELFGKTLGLLGVGNIGTEVAKRAQAFGMKVLAYDPFIKSHTHAELVSDLGSFVSRCDYISLHMPLTDDTRGMINKSLISKMKSGVYIVNTGRGKCVIEEEMVEALKSGKVGGYATDVWYSDPPDNSPLVNAPDTICLPHIGASTTENLLRIGEVVDRLIGEYAKGK